MSETCKNPFRKRRCDNTDIELYIVYNGEKCPICSNCWKKIAKSDLEWEEDKNIIKPLNSRKR